MPGVARPRVFFDLWEIKGFFLYKLKKIYYEIPGRKDEVYERITLWHCGTAREDT